MGEAQVRRERAGVSVRRGLQGTRPLQVVDWSHSIVISPLSRQGPRDTGGSWAAGRWVWPQELKPFFIDLMLAACILGYGAELCDAPLYVAGDDISDMFHTFALATLQC